MLKPIALSHGHYECRKLDETLPVLTELCAMKVIERRNGEAVLRHPNTPWNLVVHEGGPDAPEKPHNNHYGFRVATEGEIDAAHRHLEANKDRYRLTRISRPQSAHFARSVYFGEPGGNTLEIEYYDAQAVAEGRTIARPHWDAPLTETEFPGRGYIPQGLTHGTLECDDKEASSAFYRDVLGLQIAGGGRLSVYIKHASTPWYIVVLPMKRRKPLSPVNRFTLQMDGAEAVRAAHDALASLGPAGGVTGMQDIHEPGGHASFIFSDLDRNWWEVSS